MCNVGLLFPTAAPLSRQHTVDGVRVMICRHRLCYPSQIFVCVDLQKQAEKGDSTVCSFRGVHLMVHCTGV